MYAFEQGPLQAGECSPTGDGEACIEGPLSLYPYEPPRTYPNSVVFPPSLQIFFSRTVLGDRFPPSPSRTERIARGPASGGAWAPGGDR